MISKRAEKMERLRMLAKENYNEEIMRFFQMVSLYFYELLDEPDSADESTIREYNRRVRCNISDEKIREELIIE